MGKSDVWRHDIWFCYSVYLLCPRNTSFCCVNL